MPPPHEPSILISSPRPKNYIHVRPGNIYLTKTVRRLTQEANRTVYKLHDSHNRPLGILVPREIWSRVLTLHQQTRATRAAAVQRSDELLHDRTRVALQQQFPAVPREHRDAILQHALIKRSGRVARTRKLPVEDRVRLAVRAHVRHVWTDYERLMGDGMSREDARRRVQKRVDRKIEEWGGSVGGRVDGKGAMVEEGVSGGTAVNPIVLVDDGDESIDGDDDGEDDDDDDDDDDEAVGNGADGFEDESSDEDLLDLEYLLDSNRFPKTLPSTRVNPLGSLDDPMEID